MLIDGIDLPKSSSFRDVVTISIDRVTALPGTVTNDRVIQLTQQDGGNVPGIYKGVAGVWVLQNDTLDEKFAAIDASLLVASSRINAVASNTIDCSQGNYFTKTVNANVLFAFSNVPSNVAYGLTLRVTHTSGTISFPASVSWPGGNEPTITSGKTHLFVFVTDDGGNKWRGVAITNYNT